MTDQAEQERLAELTDQRIRQMHLVGRVTLAERKAARIAALRAELAREIAQLDHHLWDLADRGLTPTDLARRVDQSHTAVKKAIGRHAARTQVLAEIAEYEANHEPETTNHD